MLKKTSIGKSFQSASGRLFARLPLSANQITLFSILFAALGVCFAYLSQPLPALLLFMLAGATDAVDGAVARAKKQATARGAYMDGIADRLVEFLFILSFAFFALPPFFGIPALLSLAPLLFFGTCMTSFATAYAEHRHVADARKIARQPGIFPRAERLILLFAAFALIPSCPSCSSALIFAGAALSFVTFAQRAEYYAR